MITERDATDVRDELAERRLLKTQKRPQECPPPYGTRWTMRELAHAAWKKAGTGVSASSSAFDAWCSTRVRAAVHYHWHGSPLILAIAAWNGAHGRDSLASFPPEESAIFEPWFQDLSGVEIIADGHHL